MARPRTYDNVEDLEKAIEDYFSGPHNTAGTGWVPTITGLAYFLGFESRQSFYDYEENPEFSYAIKRARLRVEVLYEQKLSGQTCAGAIFALKNLGWKDKTEVEQSGSLTINWNEQRTYEQK